MHIEEIALCLGVLEGSASASSIVSFLADSLDTGCSAFTFTTIVLRVEYKLNVLLDNLRVGFWFNC